MLMHTSMLKKKIERKIKLLSVCNLYATKIQFISVKNESTNEEINLFINRLVIISWMILKEIRRSRRKKIN